MLRAWSLILRRRVRRKPLASCSAASGAAYLERVGVRFRFGHSVESLVQEPTRRGLRASDGNVSWHDTLVVATPVPVLRTLLPRLVLPSGVEKWANGFYFLLRRRPRGAADGDLRICLGTPWSVIHGTRYFDHRWYLWVCASNATGRGHLSGRPYPKCTLEEIRDELIAQSGFDQPELIEQFYPGQGLDWVDGKWRNEAPLYSAMLGVSELDNKTYLPGVYVAGEATKTIVKVATMEKANESGKRCAAAICKAARIAYPEAKYTYDPFPAAALRRLDGWVDSSKALFAD